MGGFFKLLGPRIWDGLKIGGRDVAAGIREAIDFKPVGYWQFFGLNIPITDTMLSIIGSIVLLTVLALVFAFHARENGNRRQVLAEKGLELFLSACESNGLSERQAIQVMPWLLTIGLYIISSNLIPLFGLRPAARNPIYPVTLAILTMLVVIVMGIRFVGVRGFLRSLLAPMPVMLPFNLLDYVIKPTSLAFRLFGNVFGSYILMEFVALIVPVVLPDVIGLWFEIGDGIIQGVVFMYLSIRYVAEVVEHGTPGTAAAQA